MQSDLTRCRAGPWALGVCLARCFCPPSFSQTRISLTSSTRATAPIIRLNLDGTEGDSAGRGFHRAVSAFRNYTTLAIQDGHGGGVLQVPPCRTLRSTDLRPGTKSKRTARWSMQYGMPMVLPESASICCSTSRRLSRRTCRWRELQDMQHLGELVRTQGTVQDKPGYNQGGAIISLPGKQEPYRLFIPRAARARRGQSGSGFTRATPSASPASRCNTVPTAPYNSGYELLVAEIGDIVLVERPPVVPQTVIASGHHGDSAGRPLPVEPRTPPARAAQAPAPDLQTG